MKKQGKANTKIIMEALLDEVGSLEAILMDDVRIERDGNSIPKLIETTVYPLLDDNTEQQYVCVTLQVLPSYGYPDVSPKFKLLRPRGLDDLRLEKIQHACEAKLQENIGFPVVFDLIEVVREHLTGSNLPSGQCVVCLYGFCDGDEFVRTECYHYLHSFCLRRHINATRCNYMEEYNKLPAWQQRTTPPFQPLCPVCREPIKDDSEKLTGAVPPIELQNAPDFKPTQELRELQRKMSVLFLHQKHRGAIIDTETDDALVISIETEEDMNRSGRRRRDEISTTERPGCNNHHLSGPNSPTNNSYTSSPEQTSALTKQQKNNFGNDSNCTNASASTSAAATGTATATLAAAIQSNDPTNNNNNNNNTNHHHNQYGKRSTKGGRRHHYQQYQQTERERERFQHHHIPSNSALTQPNSTTTSHSSTPQSAQTNTNKQTKSHSTGSNAHNR